MQGDSFFLGEQLSIFPLWIVLRPGFPVRRRGDLSKESIIMPNALKLCG